MQLHLTINDTVLRAGRVVRCCRALSASCSVGCITAEGGVECSGCGQEFGFGQELGLAAFARHCGNKAPEAAATERLWDEELRCHYLVRCMQSYYITLFAFASEKRLGRGVEVSLPVVLRAVVPPNIFICTAYKQQARRMRPVHPASSRQR